MAKTVEFLPICPAIANISCWTREAQRPLEDPSDQCNR